MQKLGAFLPISKAQIKVISMYIVDELILQLITLIKNK